jgi:hypothetical protein
MMPVTLPLIVDAAFLAQVEQAMEAAWYALELADRRKLPRPIVERFYHAYLDALQALDAAQARYQQLEPHGS